jgi:hypothetical protein
MRQFMITVMALGMFGATVVTAQAQTPRSGARIGMAEALSAAPLTCTGMQSVCRSHRMCDTGGHPLAHICGGKFCDWEFEQCMKSGWWQVGRGISRPVERR